MWKLSIEDDQGQQTVVNLVRDEYSIGRAEDNTIRLTERNISRRHALLVRDRERWFLEDLQSYNGAFVNGVRIGGRQELAHGDLVQLGDYRIELMDEDLATREQGHRRMPTDPFLRRDSLTHQPDRFVMLIGPSQGAEFSLEAERTVMGRGDECDLCINHASVSRVHAEVRKLEDGRYELVDKGSANGVRVNGVDLERTLLDARDVIELGDVVLKFIPAGEVFRTDAEDSKRYTLSAVNSIRSKDGSRLEPKTIAAAVSLILVALVVSVVASRNPAAEATMSSAKEVSGDHSLLQQATLMARDGDVFGAHERLRELPADSELRGSPDYRRIETDWADAMLKAAQGEPDNAKKRALLSEVARTPSVAAEQRTEAAKALSALGPSAVDVADLEGTTPEGSELEGELAEREEELDEGEPNEEPLATASAAQAAPVKAGATAPAAKPKAQPTPQSSVPASPAPLPSGDQPW